MTAKTRNGRGWLTAEGRKYAGLKTVTRTRAEGAAPMQSELEAAARAEFVAASWSGGAAGTYNGERAEAAWARMKRSSAALLAKCGFADAASARRAARRHLAEDASGETRRGAGSRKKFFD